MKTKILCVFVALFILAAPVLAQGGGAYTIVWSTTVGSAAFSMSGSYELSGTIGQAITGQAGSTSPSDYTLTSGFWSVVHAWVTQFRTYLPLLAR